MLTSRGLRADRIAMIVIGSLFASLSMHLFIAPAGILSGGLSGLALLLHYTLKAPIGLSVLVLNIPVFYLGIKKLQRGYIYRSLIGAGCFVAFLSGWDALLDIKEPLVDDLLLSALFGGVVNGIGLGLTFRGRGSVGGTDIIAGQPRILVQQEAVHSSHASRDSGLVLFDLKLIGYTLVTMFVSAYVVDRVQAGLIRSKVVTIISAKHEEISQAIIARIGRGVTLLHGEGAFSHSSKQIILTTVSLTQLTKLKDIVAELDHTAFMTVSDASEVLGKGFGLVRDDDN